MKCLSLVGSLLFSFAVAACAQQSATPPLGKASGQHDTPKDFSLVRVGQTCQFRIRTTAGEHYSPAAGGSYMFYDAKPSAWGFPIRCYAGASQEEIDIQLDAKKVNGQWIWYNPGAGNIPENPPFTPEQRFHAYALSGKNWKGTAITYDDTTGDEATRGRNLFFCLVETGGPQVLCGGPISVMTLVDPPSTSTRPKIMAVLKTIEFVDAPASQPAASSTSGQ